MEASHNLQHCSDVNYDPEIAQDISYKKLMSILDIKLKSQIKCNKAFGPISLQSQILKDFVNNLKISHNIILESKTALLAELFILHQIAISLDRYNKEHLKLKDLEFRTTLYYPNLIYILVRLLPKAKTFIQNMIRTVYNEIKQKSNVVKLYTNLPDIDEDVIKSDVLYNFVGSGLKSINPLGISDIYSFYKSVFRNILFYYFKENKKDTVEYIDFGNEITHEYTANTRLKLYKMVLYDLQNEKFLATSPSLQQLNYNFQVFKNIIGDNELQSVYFSSFNRVVITNNQYKLLRIYYDDLNDSLSHKIKELPLIYKLLRCVKIRSNTQPYVDSVIQKDAVENAVFEELLLVFKDFIGDTFVSEILRKIANNFIKEFLTGEYINLMTLTTIKIKEISFITQLRKFVKLCLVESIGEK